MCPIDSVHRGRYGYYVMARDIIKEMNRDIKENPSRYTFINWWKIMDERLKNIQGQI